MASNIGVLTGGETANVPSAYNPAIGTTSALPHDEVDASLKTEVHNNGDETHDSAEGGATADEPVIDIDINNVVSSFSTRCHLNLKRIATESCNVEYKRANGMVNMRLRQPYVTASIWSSGKITCVGATSEVLAKIAARKIARKLQRMGFRVRFSNFRVVNVLGTCSMPFGIRLNQFTENNYQNASYEPELHPAVTYKIKEPKATLKVFSTGSITITAPCVANVQHAVEHIFPLVYQFKMPKRAPKVKKVSRAEQQYTREKYKRARICLEDSEDEEDSWGSGESDSEFDSEDSMD